MNKLSQMFGSLLSNLAKDNSPERQQDKAKFIEQRVLRLANQNLDPEILSSKVSGFLDYSMQGVMNALAFNKGSLTPELKAQVIDVIQHNPIQHNLSLDHVSYQNSQHNGISALYSESLTPKIAVISTGNDYANSKIITYSDKTELNKLITDEAIQDCFKQFKQGNMEAEHLVSNLINLSPDKDIAFAKIITGVNNQIDPIREALTQEFDFKTQLDKMLRSENKVGVIAKTIIAELDKSGELLDYQESRLDRYSVLPDLAKQKLMLAIEDYDTNQSRNQPLQENLKPTQQPENYKEPINNTEIENNKNEIKPTQKIIISELAKDHETLFKKVNVGDTHYWENTEKSVKIHPERITIPKLSRDSVELAISAAVMNFGNKIKIQGTEQFKENVLEILSNNEKYKNVTLANPELQQKLDEMRGTVINSIEASNQNKTENVIIAPENTHSNNNAAPEINNKISDEVKSMEQNTPPNISSTVIEPQINTNIEQPPTHPQLKPDVTEQQATQIDSAPLKIIDSNKKIEFPVNNNNDVIQFFKNNYPEHQQVIEDLTKNGYIEVPGVNGGMAQLNDEPTHLVNIVSKAIDSEIACKENKPEEANLSPQLDLDALDLSKTIDDILNNEEHNASFDNSRKI